MKILIKRILFAYTYIILKCCALKIVFSLFFHFTISAFFSSRFPSLVICLLNIFNLAVSILYNQPRILNMHLAIQYLSLYISIQLYLNQPDCEPVRRHSDLSMAKSKDLQSKKDIPEIFNWMQLFTLKSRWDKRSL